MTPPAHVFLPWVREGLASAINTTDSGDATPARASIDATLTLGDDPPVTVTVQLNGPADVLGIDERQVIRTIPTPGALSFEPNLLAAIEFDRPDLPWLFSPVAAPAAVGADGDPAAPPQRLRPWICLAVLPDEAGIEVSAGGRGSLPVLRIAEAAGHKLPPLRDSWAWAHAQVSGDPAEIDAALASHPGRTLSRLVAPRRLEPSTRYVACVVPTFDAGLGAQSPASTLAPAWTRETGPLELPVYYHWRFGTGPAGDFESLARELSPRPLPSGVGRRPLRIDTADRRLPAADRAKPAATVDLYGALRPVGIKRVGWPAHSPNAFQTALRELIDAPQIAGAPRVLAPPLYGRWHAAQPTVPDTEPHWLGELNLDPRHRAAAALGTRIVQERQQELMASAWRQIGLVNETNRLLRRAKLARAAGAILLQRHLASLHEADVLLVTAPVHARVVDGDRTLRATVERSALPEAMLTPAMRSLLRFRGPAARRGLPGRARLLVEGLANGELTLAPAQRLAPGAIAADILPAEQLAELAPPDRYRLRPAWQTSADVHSWGPGDPLGPELTSDPQGQFDVQAAHDFRNAAVRLSDSFEKLTKPRDQPVAPPLDLDAAARTLLTMLDPALTVPAWIAGRLTRPRGDEPDDPLDDVLAAPNFPTPMWQPLAALDERLLLAGLDEVPRNTVTVVETNSEFVEAYMVGLNHEMARELLWREYPTDQRGSPFRQFWDPVTAGPADRELLYDIDAIHTWRPADHLGDGMRRRGRAGALVLLLRGDLLHRYPRCAVYAVRGDGSDGLGTEELHPIFRGQVGSDVVFFGFALAAADAMAQPGWWFVFQEQPTEPRFGLDEPVADTPERPGTPATPIVPDDLAWSHVEPLVDGHIDLSGSAPARNLNRIRTSDGRTWAQHGDAATLAAWLWQRPVRVAIHASELLESQGAV